MNLTPRSNGIYQLTYKGRRISTGHRDLKKAEKAAKRIIANNGRRPTKTGSAWTVRDAFEDTYRRIWQHQKSERELRYRIKKLMREDGHVDVGEISYKWLVSLVDRLRARGDSPATINRKLACYSKALREAHKLGYIDTVPPIPKQKEPKAKLRWVSFEEQDALCRVTGDLFARREAEFMVALVNSLAYTGARISELLKACREVEYGKRMGRWENPDDIFVAFIDTKNETDRSIPLQPSILPYLEAITRFLDYYPKVDADWCGRRFKMMTKEAGIKGVTLHTLRHTCASRMVQAGVDLYRVRDWLGHSSIVTTERYAHLAPKSLDSAAAALVPPVNDKLRSVK